jgi:uncharacterized protein involved in exopolysaccharide biosynthesis
MISIAFEWTDARFAALAANTYADEYATQYALLSESQRLHGFYADQVDLLTRKLKEADDRYKKFLSSSGIADAGLQKELLIRRIAELDDRITAADIDMSQAQARLKGIRESTGSSVESIETPESPVKRAGMELTLAQAAKSNLVRQLSSERKKLSSINSAAIELQQLQRERDIAEGNYRNYRKAAEHLRVSDDMLARKISSVKVAVPAVPPITPVHPKKGLIIICSAIGGLLLGFVLAAVREFFNDTFRHDDDVARILDVPLLLSVPLQTFDSGVVGLRTGAMNGGASRLQIGRAHV